MKDNQLQIVRFEQAKRLKELGFDWAVKTSYAIGCDNLRPEFRSYLHYNRGIRCNDTGKELISAPTVALALKWIRDVKTDCVLSVCINQTSRKYFYIVDEHDDYYVGDDFNAYEAAESALLDELLNLLEQETA